MRIFKNYGTTPDARAVAEAAEALREGQIIIYPTDTLYAFGCDGLNNRAIERLCRIKGIDPAKNLLAIVCADISEAAEYARIDNAAYRILRRYLPGPRSNCQRCSRAARAWASAYPTTRFPSRWHANSAAR